MKTIRKSISINAPVAEVFDYLTDPQHLPEIWPSLMEVSNVTLKPDGTHSFDWVYRMAGMHFKGHTETIESERNKRVVTRNEKGIPSTFRWTYDGTDGVTTVTMEVAYTLPGKMFDKLAAPFLVKMNEREAETLLQNLKTRMERVGTSAAARPQPEPTATHH